MINAARLRIGTFNVNGKMPSQDLSQWIRPQSHQQRPSLPPLRRISPLKVPYVDRLQPALSNYTNDDPNEDTKFEVKEPDMIVLGLQEVDLSAEALIYSTATTREDAWVAAVFAGLGEVREDYVKV